MSACPRMQQQSQQQQANGDSALSSSPRKKQRTSVVPSEPVSKVTVVLGAQWGDEGKGKVVDMLAMEADVVCRCQVCQLRRRETKRERERSRSFSPFPSLPLSSRSFPWPILRRRSRLLAIDPGPPLTVTVERAVPCPLRPRRRSDIRLDTRTRSVQTGIFPSPGVCVVTLYSRVDFPSYPYTNARNETRRDARDPLRKSIGEISSREKTKKKKKKRADRAPILSRDPRD